MRLEKSDEKIFKLVAIKVSNLTECKIQKASFENLWGIAYDQSFRIWYYANYEKLDV